MLKPATAVMLVLCCLLVAPCLVGCSGKTTSETDAAFPIATVAGSDGANPSVNTWTELEPAGEVPIARGDTAMAYDPESGKIVLFGGEGDCGKLADTWELTF